MPVYGYCRVSTGSQEISLAAQEERIRDYCKYKGLELSQTFIDQDVSGRIPLSSRLQGRKLAALLEKGDSVLFAKLDRGFRNVRDIATCIEKWSARGIALHFLDLNVSTADPAGRFFIHMMGAMAEFERARISERIRDAQVLRARLGLAIGSPPYGFRNVGPFGRRRRVPDENQRALGKKIVEWKQKGYSWEDLYWHLRRSGIKNRAGQELTISAIRGLFRGELTGRAGWPKSANGKSADGKADDGKTGDDANTQPKTNLGGTPDVRT